MVNKMDNLIELGKLFTKAYNFIENNTPSKANPICTCGGNKICLNHLSTDLVRELLEALENMMRKERMKIPGTGDLQQMR